MRAGLSTIQQTLTPEAASVLNHSIAEAGRRNHGQTTPLHVAATLLASPTGFLRQACIRSHPNSSHPLQCRALELCFSVALERLPTAQNTGMEPPISNALMAALKRAQAHQRRGCPEQQQQPLLAVKVELEQLIISILDDPSVSRVMREASFSSPAVKATIEQQLNATASAQHHQQQQNLTHHPNLGGPFGGLGSRMLMSPTPSANQRPMMTTPIPAPSPMMMPLPGRNMYLNPRLQQGGAGGQSGNQRTEEVKKVTDILMRTKKRNPVLVGEGEPEAVVKELLKRIEKGELNTDGGGESQFKNVEVISIDKEFLLDKNLIPSKIKDLGGLIESRIAGRGGVIVDLGDLKWLVEQPAGLAAAAGSTGQQQQQVVSETGREAVVEMGKLLARFCEGGSGSGKIWLIGTATCETYLRCQVYHPTMENDWDLQAVPITSRSPLPGMFPRLGTDRSPSNPVGSLTPMKSFPSMMPALTRRVSENLNPAGRIKCCSQCSENYAQELAKLTSSESDKSSSEVKLDASRTTLPLWLQNAKLHNNESRTTDQLQDKDEKLEQKRRELQKMWTDTCMRLHPDFHNKISTERISSSTLSMTGLCAPNLLGRQPFQPKLQMTRNLGDSLQLNSNQTASLSSTRVGSPPGSPVRTELVLGRKVSEANSEKTNENQVKDFLGCISSEPQTKFLEKFASALDADSFKKLLKGLMEKAWWQQEAASALASAVTRCRLGNGKQRGGASKGDIWLLFAGPDRVAKRKMASVLSEQICGTNPVTICLGSRRDDGETDMNFRGKTAIDRIAEAVRRNPFTVILLEDIDEADLLVRGSIKRAIERGRLTDSHGREISLGNVIIILTGNWSTIDPKSIGDLIDEKKLCGDSQFQLIIGEKSAKRRASWLYDENRTTKPRKDLGSGLSFDLNETADTEEDRTDGSNNSSDLTIDHEEELGLDNGQFSITSLPHELLNVVDDAIVFKPPDFAFVRREIKKTIATKFSMVVDDKVSIDLDEEAVERIIGGLWQGQTSLEEWVQKVLAPSFDQLKPRLPDNEENTIVRLRLEAGRGPESRRNGDWQLPSRVSVVGGEM